MKILIVDDDYSIQSLIATVLKKAGYEIQLASSAADALRAFRAVRPDLVLLDINLPDDNGYSVCRQIRAEAGAALPVLFLSTLSDLRNRVEGFDAGAQDYISKPVALEELLARVGAHLRSKQTLDEAMLKNSELEMSERLRRDMTDMIVHDLKVPLTSIQLSLDIIKGQGLIDDLQYGRLVEISQTASGMMLIMINDLLDVAKSKQGGLKAEISSIHIPALLKKLESLLESTSRNKGVHFQIRSSVDSDPVQTDQQLLFRILANLTSNAIKFSSKGGEVLVECSCRPGALFFTVSDRGPGVPQSEKQSIFEKFIRGSAKSAIIDRGSGVGLSFCRVAADALGGRIWVEDREGGGSRFVLDLPVTANINIS